MPKKENTGTSGAYRIHRSVVWFSSRRCLDALAGNIYTNWLLSCSADNQKSIHLSSYIYAPTFGFVQHIMKERYLNFTHFADEF